MSTIPEQSCTGYRGAYYFARLSMIEECKVLSCQQQRLIHDILASKGFRVHSYLSGATDRGENVSPSTFYIHQLERSLGLLSVVCVPDPISIECRGMDKESAVLGRDTTTWSHPNRSPEPREVCPLLPHVSLQKITARVRYSEFVRCLRMLGSEKAIDFTTGGGWI